MITFNIRGAGGRLLQEVNVPHIEEMTIADYLRMQIVPEAEANCTDDLLRLILTMERVFQVSELNARMMKMGEIRQMLDIYQSEIEKGAREWATAANVGKLLDEQTEESWNITDAINYLLSNGTHRTSFEHEGVTYLVPQDLGETIFAQWVDLKATIRGSAVAQHDINEVLGVENGPRPSNRAIDHEARMFPEILSILCLPEGQEYKGDYATAKEHLKRVEAFQRVPYIEALWIVAFFFSSSTEFAELVRQEMPSFLKWKEPSKRPARVISLRTGVSDPS